MNVCNPFLPQGINNSCLQDLKEIRNILPTNISASFTSSLDAANLVTWKTKIQTDLSVYAPLGLNDYEPTTPAPTITKMQSTRQTISDRPIPSAVFHLASNFCDYKDVMAAFQGGVYRLFFVDGNVNIVGTKTTAGVVRGFACQLTALTAGFALKGNVQDNFKVWANFLSYEEFERAVMLELTWNPTIELTEAMPVGLFLENTSAITAGSITVRLRTRCASGITGMAAADWEVLESSELITPGIATCTDNANGDYTLTIKKSTSTPLAAGDMVVIRCNKIVSTKTTYLSNRLTINALA